MESVGNHFIIAGVLSSTKKMMLGLLCLFLVARLNDAASLDLGSQPEGVIALTSEVNHVGEKYTSEDDSEKHGYIYYGIRYATAERFEVGALTGIMSTSSRKPPENTGTKAFKYHQNPNKIMARKK